MNIFKPSPRYLTRLRVVITLWATGILALGILTAWLVSLNDANTRLATMILQGVILADLLWYLPALKIVQSAYRVRTYQFDEEEITIRSGWWAESIRHIPLSSVISFEMRWDRLDRWLEIGTLEMQIASRYHVNGSRICMSGLSDVETVAQLADRLLKHMRNERLAEWIFPKERREGSILGNRY
jgi:membrane protein YdbS with pleckstrin-like domain